MKLWAEYIKEREGASIIYDDNCFVTYKEVNDNDILVIDLYVIPELRKSGTVQNLWTRLIQETNPKVVYGMTDIAALNWEASHNFMTKFGFVPCLEEGNTIYYRMEIANG
jgi:hypothetical protein